MVICFYQLKIIIMTKGIFKMEYKFQRRERKLEAKKRQMKVSGKGIAKIYENAQMKRIAERQKNKRIKKDEIL